MKDFGGFQLELAVVALAGPAIFRCLHCWNAPTSPQMIASARLIEFMLWKNNHATHYQRLPCHCHGWTYYHHV